MITFTLEVISPTKAAEYMTRNTRNRKRRPMHVASLVRDIHDGQWQTTHQPIAFDIKGRLVDGQHRLEACIVSGISITAYVARYEREVESAMTITVDKGITRTHADSLQITSKQSQVCTALIRVQGLTKRGSHSTREVGELYAKFGDLIEEMEDKSKHKTVVFRTSAAAKAAMVLTVLNHPERKQDLLEQWRHFVTLEDLKVLQPSFVALMRYADTSSNLAHRFEESVCRCMIAFSPKNWNFKTNRIRDLSEVIKSVEETANRVL